jgi:hypothetical protein
MERIIRAVYHFGRASQHLWLVNNNDGCSGSLALTMPASLAPEPHDAWSFRHPLALLAGVLVDEGTLSRQLHTGPLSAPHVSVGYR